MEIDCESTFSLFLRFSLESSRVFSLFEQVIVSRATSLNEYVIFINLFMP